jgi:peptidyl-prolyl cis-trans isomerase A (cyclophilin A)
MFGMGEKEKSDYKEEGVNLIKVNFKTNMGEFKAEMYADKCPETVWNFVNLAEGRQESVKEGNYFDGLIFHRVINGFMIQGGCPEGSGRGNPGYRFADEFHPELKHTEAGIFSMANSGPATNGSQFFITLAPTPHLDNRHTVFGKVVEGMDIIEAIGNTRTGMQDRPAEDIVIESVTVERA